MIFKPLQLLIIIFFCILTAACHQADAYDSHNQPVRLTDYQNKWVVINYWATWCKPCITELPELNALYLNNKNKVVVLGVNFDALSNEEINAIAEKWKISFPLLRSFPLEKLAVKNINSVPVTFLISPQGKLIETFYGPQTEESLLAAMK